MVEVNFIKHDGEKITLEGTPGESLMNVAVDNEVPGIDADCGGSCSCATCHVYVDEAWLDKTGERKKDEEQLLNLNPDRQDNSRLSCQIELSGELNGITVHLPEFQF